MILRIIFPYDLPSLANRGRDRSSTCVFDLREPLMTRKEPLMTRKGPLMTRKGALMARKGALMAAIHGQRLSACSQPAAR